MTVLSNKISLITISLCFVFAANCFADTKMKCSTSVIKNMDGVSQLRNSSLFNEISISENGQKISVSVNLKALASVNSSGLIDFSGDLKSTESEKSTYQILAKNIENSVGGSLTAGSVAEINLVDFQYNKNSQVEFKTMQILIHDENGTFIKDMRVFGKTICK